LAQQPVRPFVEQRPGIAAGSGWLLAAAALLLWSARPAAASGIAAESFGYMYKLHIELHTGVKGIGRSGTSDSDELMLPQPTKKDACVCEKSFG
jgi:hypothetical protein